MALSTRLIFRASLIRNYVAACAPNGLSKKFPVAHPASVSQLHFFRSLSTSDDPRVEENEEGEGGQEAQNRAHKKYREYVCHPVETSIRYMNSNAYKRAYGDQPVWVQYRRNFKGQYPPETRLTCVRQGLIRTGSPCPIHRDEYLVVHYTNTALLEQFISPTTGQILKTMKTGLCQKIQFKLELEIMKAYDFGTLQFEVPLRQYRLKEFYPHLREIEREHQDSCQEAQEPKSEYHATQP